MGASIAVGDGEIDVTQAGGEVGHEQSDRSRAGYYVCVAQAMLRRGIV
jgi:hypothetical protein